MIINALKTSFLFGGFCCLFSLITFFGYVTGVELLYRPFENGAATHPLTAITAFLIGLALLPLSELEKYKPHSLLLILSASISLLILIEPHINGSVSHYFTPYNQVVLTDINNNLSNAMGGNTAMMFLLLSISLLFNKKYLGIPSQFIAFTALAIPTVSITGYVYNITEFFGQMSPITTLWGLMLSLGTLARYSEIGAVYALLTPHIGGRIARYQAVLGYLVPFSFGYLFVESLANNGGSEMFGVYVVSVCWFIIVLVTISAIVQEMVDKRRRDAEADLYFQATHDQLTKLPTQRQFFEVAEKAFLNAKNSGQTSWLLMINLDNFKAVNENGGHQTGDEVLKLVAELIRNTVEEDTCISRTGGEEFCILLNDKSMGYVIEISEKIRTLIEQTQIANYTEYFGAITTSIGIAKSENETLNNLAKKADLALYQAKSQGRNQVFFYKG